MNQQALEALIEDEALADKVHAELKRQQAFSIERHGKVALAVAPFMEMIGAAAIEAYLAATTLPLGAEGELVDDAVHRLRSFAKAYPESIFAPLTEEERKLVGDGLISRNSAEVGRHFAKFAVEGGHLCNWPACSPECDGRPGVDAYSPPPVDTPKRGRPRIHPDRNAYRAQWQRDKRAADAKA